MFKSGQLICTPISMGIEFPSPNFITADLRTSGMYSSTKTPDSNLGSLFTTQPLFKRKYNARVFSEDEEWEITAASEKLAECQKTILNLGKQLKAMATQREAALFDKVLTDPADVHTTKVVATGPTSNKTMSRICPLYLI